MRLHVLLLPLLLTAQSTVAEDAVQSDPEPVVTTQAAPVGLVVPELPSADMRLSWSDFRELLQLLQPPAGPKTPDEEAPPWPWTLTSARFVMDATDADGVRVEATFGVEVWAESWSTVPLLGNTVALTEVSVDGVASALRDDGGWFTWLTRDPGAHTVSVAFYTRPREQEGDVTLSFPMASAAVTEVRLLLGTDAAAVSSPQAASVVIEARDGGQEAVLALLPSETLELHWRRPSLIREKAPTPPPRITAETLAQVRLSPRLLEGVARVQFDVLRGETNHFSLDLPTDVVILGVEGKGLEWSVTEEGEVQHLQLALNHSVSGPYPVMVRYELPLASNPGPVAVPRILARDVARQGGLIGLSAVRNTNVAIAEPTQGVSRTDPEGHFDLGLEWTLIHAFRYGQPDYALTVAATEVEPRVVAESEMLANVSDVAFHASAQVQFRVLRGETRKLAFLVPADVNILAVEGEGMDWFAVETDRGRRVDLELNEPVTGEFRVTVDLERTLDGTDEMVPVPVLVVEEVARQRGWIGIAAAGNVKVDIGEGSNGVTRIDETELPPGVLSRAASPVLHAFSYQQVPYTLPLSVTRLDDVAVRVAAIDNVELATVVTDEMVITRARYWVRNNQRQFLRVDPGANAEIWGAQADGHVVSPARDPESESGVLLRMRKSEEQVGGLGSFPMELIYMQRPPLHGLWWRNVELAAPFTDILADRMEWTVYLPDGETVVRTRGGMETAPDRPTTASPDRGAVSMGEMETIHRLREGIERFLITDINNPAGSARSQSKTFTDRQYGAIETSDSSVRLAGVLPVHINLPQTGVPHRFERVLVSQGERVGLTIQTRSRNVLRTLGVLSGAAGFVLVSLLWVRGGMGSRTGVRRAWWTILAAAALVLGYALLQIMWSAALFALLGAVLGSVVQGVWRMPRGRFLHGPREGAL